jgi:phosphomannomutase
MSRKFFGTDGIRGTANTEPMTPGDGAQGGDDPRSWLIP